MLAFAYLVGYKLQKLGEVHVFEMLNVLKAKRVKKKKAWKPVLDLEDKRT